MFFPLLRLLEQVPAILRETSEKTSNQMVRLVFPPYTQIRRTICTSVSLRASIRVSSDFPLVGHSSPSFGSQRLCSYSNLSGDHSDRSLVHHLRILAAFTFIPHWGFVHPNTRIYVRLLGPCYKTGRLGPVRRQHHERELRWWAKCEVAKTAAAQLGSPVAAHLHSRPLRTQSHNKGDTALILHSGGLRPTDGVCSAWL